VNAGIPAALVATLVAGAVTAAGGTLDHGFGDRGFAVVDGVTSCLAGEGGCTVGIGLAIQRDGAAVAAAGTLESDCRSRFAIVRLRAGRLDPAFGHAGRVLTRFGSSAAVANAVVVAPDGKIIVAGERRPPGPWSCGDHLHLGGGDGFALARYHRDGTLDESFGGNGTVVTTFENAGAVDLLLQRDGKIVAVGFSADKIALARYLRDGQLDRSFGHEGTLVTPSRSGGVGEQGRPALDHAGRIVMPQSGCWGCAASVVRYTHDGRLDRTFGDAGTAQLPLAARAVKARGRWIFVAGLQGHDDRVVVVRLSARGVIDRSFGRNGLALPRTPGRGWMYDLALQKNGKLVVLATMPVRESGGYALTRLLPNGLRDRSFGRGGMATVQLARGSSGRRVAIQRDGKLVVASMVGSSRPVLTVTRHLP
jgi:uncharacterized delta-60 repeat protein